MFEKIFIILHFKIKELIKGKFCDYVDNYFTNTFFSIESNLRASFWYGGREDTSVFQLHKLVHNLLSLIVPRNNHKNFKIIKF